jgi:hypothetical protein
MFALSVGASRAAPHLLRRMRQIEFERNGFSLRSCGMVGESHCSIFSSAWEDLVCGHDCAVHPLRISRYLSIVKGSDCAAHRGDFDALVAVLDPDVVLRSDGGKRRRALSFVHRGAAELARMAIISAQSFQAGRREDENRPVLTVKGVIV